MFAAIWNVGMFLESLNFADELCQSKYSKKRPCKGVSSFWRVTPSKIVISNEDPKIQGSWMT